MHRSVLTVALLTVSSLAVGNERGTAWPVSDDTPNELASAYSHYIAKDFEKAGQYLVAAMTKYDSKSIRANGLEMFAAMQKELGCEPFPAGWALPDGISDVKISQFRREIQGRVSYSLSVTGAMDAEGRLSDIRFRDEDGNVIVHAAAGIGEFVVEPEDGHFKFYIEQDRTSEPLASGLYFVDFHTNQGQKVEGWVIMSNHVATSSPVLVTPRNGAVIQTAKPALRWEDYHSPEYSSCDRRSIYTNVRPVNSDKEVWGGYWGSNELRTSAIIGTDGEGSAEGLADGIYAWSLRYNEHWGFGPVRLRRSSMSRSNFTVEK